ncbi:MAG: VOC family protein [Halopseudomonas aestusnigri]
MTSSPIEIDHIFVFVDPVQNQDPFEAHLLQEAGFIESYRRDHPGQGTTNICYCFDNAYLELLWVNDEQAIRSNVISNTRLAERSQWKNNGSSPFGIALRPELPFETWNYQPPYLPPEMTIPVACSSLDPMQPFIFQSPGGKRPDAWNPYKSIKKQDPEKFREIAHIELNTPVNTPHAADLTALNKIGLITLSQDTPHHALRLSLTNPIGEITHYLELPACKVIAVD